MVPNPPRQLTDMPGFRDFAAHFEDVAIFSGDESGYHYMSPGFENIWGIPVQEVMDDIWRTLELIHPEDRERMERILENSGEMLDRGEAVEIEHRVVRPDDEIRWVETRMFPVHDDQGEVLQVVGVTIDITDRKRAEKALEVQNERLERFAETVSHDLRTPLTSARGYLDLIAEDVEHDHLEPLDRSLDRMEQMIEQVLTLARTGRGDVPTVSVCLEEAIEEAWSTTQEPASTLHMEADPGRVTADPGLLRRLFENLFRNAIEHAESDVTVRVGPLAEGNGLYVADDGPGIPPADRDAVLDPGAAGPEGGSGLGLAIVQEICELHDWEVSVEAAESGGAKFVLSGFDRP